MHAGSSGVDLEVWTLAGEQILSVPNTIGQGLNTVADLKRRLQGETSVRAPRQRILNGYQELQDHEILTTLTRPVSLHMLQKSYLNSEEAFAAGVLRQLEIAMLNGQVDVVRELLAGDSDQGLRPVDPDVCFWDTKTGEFSIPGLRMAGFYDFHKADYKNAKLTEAFLQAGADPNIVTAFPDGPGPRPHWINSNSGSLLLEAIRRGHPAAVKVLLKWGADPNMESWVMLSDESGQPQRFSRAPQKLMQESLRSIRRQIMMARPGMVGEWHTYREIKWELEAAKKNGRGPHPANPLRLIQWICLL